MTILRKLLLAMFINAVCIQAQATIEDAEQALQDLQAFSVEVADAVEAELYDQAINLFLHISQQTGYAKDELDHQIANITSKISTMAESVSAATGRPVGECVRSSEGDLQNFADEWRYRIDDCTGYMKLVGDSVMYTARTRMWYEYDIDYNCTQSIFKECQQLQGGECPDAVMGAIASARASMERAVDLLTAEMANTIIGIHFPCMDMVHQALAAYPPMILDFTQSCLDQIVANSYSFSC